MYISIYFLCMGITFKALALPRDAVKVRLCPVIPWLILSHQTTLCFRCCYCCSLYRLTFVCSAHKKGFHASPIRLLSLYVNFNYRENPQKQQQKMKHRVSKKRNAFNGSIKKFLLNWRRRVATALWGQCSSSNDNYLQTKRGENARAGNRRRVQLTSFWSEANTARCRHSNVLGVNKDPIEKKNRMMLSQSGRGNWQCSTYMTRVHARITRQTQQFRPTDPLLEPELRRIDPWPTNCLFSFHKRPNITINLSTDFFFQQRINSDN